LAAAANYSDRFYHKVLIGGKGSRTKIIAALFCFGILFRNLQYIIAYGQPDWISVEMRLPKWGLAGTYMPRSLI
jgi:hypothetical protein